MIIFILIEIKILLNDTFFLELVNIVHIFKFYNNLIKAMNQLVQMTDSIESVSPKIFPQ